MTGIQHAIKNMLHALRGGAYLVRNGMAKDNRERVQEGWAMVEEGIERIGDLSHHMLNYAKEWKLELKRVDLNDLVWKEYHGGECPEVLLKHSLTERGDFFVIEVRDNGCGMDEEIRRNVFTPFFSTKKTLGTGLGLALTARIVKLHSGMVSVESAPDRGAVFRIHLPIDGRKDDRQTVDGQAGSRN